MSLFALMWSVRPAGAAPIFPGPYVSASGAVAGDGSLDAYDTVTTGALIASSYTYQKTETAVNGFTEASVDANVQQGVMHYTSTVTSIRTSGSPYPNNPSAGFDLEYGDLITATSTSVAAGTLVPFLFTLHLDYAATSAAFFGAKNYGNVGLFFESDTQPYACPFGVAWAQCEPFAPGGSLSWYVENGQTASGSVTLNYAVNLAVGDDSWFVQRLWSRNFQTQIPSGSGGTNLLDVGNTVWVTVQSLNPNVSFTSASGYSYVGDPDAVAAAPVPEPTSLLLLGTGGLGVLTKLRKRRKERAAS